MNRPDDAGHFLDLDRTFDLALARCVAGSARACVLFSGGVDSALVASGVRDLGPLHLISIGTAGSKDVDRASSAARELGLPVEIVQIPEAAVGEMLNRGSPRLGSLREPMRSVQVALALAFAHAPDATVLVGQGADELFGGYSHFRNLSDEQLVDRRGTDWDRLRTEDWPISLRLASEFGKDLRSPFLDEGLATVALEIPLERVDGSGLTKPLLRRWARHRGLPEELVARPKLAMQYGSGVARAVDRAVRRRDPTESPPAP